MAPEGRARTLGDVIGTLDSEVLQVVRPPAGEDPVISDVTIFDPTDESCVHAGAIVLAVGLVGTEGDALALVDRAGRCRASAVVFRTDAALPNRLVEIAEAVDLAILSVPAAMRWGQLHALMRTAASASTLADAGAAGVPVGDLFALADAIAARVGGPVTIEDPQWRLLAYANLDYEIDEARRQTILGRTPPEAWQQRLDEAGVTRALRTGERAVRFEGAPEDGLAPRLAVPVRAGDELLGSIWVAESGGALTERAADELERAAKLAAVHLICHRASDDVKRRTRGVFVREVLEGRLPHRTDAVLRQDVPVSVLVFEPQLGDAALPVDPDRALSVIGLFCEDAHRDAMAAWIDERFWVLLPDPAGQRRRLVALAERIIERVEQSLRVTLRAGLAGPAPTLADVPRARRMAEQALTVLRERPTPKRAVHIDEVRAHAVLLELLDIAAGRPSLAQGRIDALVAHDGERGTAYVETLRAYLDCWGDVGAAARRLGLHANTMRYRIRRVVEVSGLDLADPDERLVAELQLRMRAAR
jgi:hypothetical protein